MENHQACWECVLNGDCLFQNNSDVESCDDVKDYEKKEKE
jgi:hypothetical protein